MYGEYEKGPRHVEARALMLRGGADTEGSAPAHNDDVGDAGRTARRRMERPALINFIYRADRASTLSANSKASFCH